MMRALGWLVVLVGVVLIAAGVFSYAHGYLVAPGLVVFAAGVATLARESEHLDVVDRDLAEKRDDLLTRWQPGSRGAGWQKPVAPPSDEQRPGGLPPKPPIRVRVERDREA